MFYVDFDCKSLMIISSSPKKGWSIHRNGVGDYTLVYKKPSLIKRILNFILPS